MTNEFTSANYSIQDEEVNTPLVPNKEEFKKNNGHQAARFLSSANMKVGVTRNAVANAVPRLKSIAAESFVETKRQINTQFDYFYYWAQRTFFLDPSALKKVTRDIETGLGEYVKAQIQTLRENLEAFNVKIDGDDENKLNVEQIIQSVLFQHINLEITFPLDLAKFAPEELFKNTGIQVNDKARLVALLDTPEKKEKFTKLINEFAAAIASPPKYLNRNYFTGIPNGDRHFKHVKTYVNNVIKEQSIGELNSLRSNNDHIHLNSSNKERLETRLVTLKESNQSFKAKYRVTHQGAKRAALWETAKGYTHAGGSMVLGCLALFAVTPFVLKGAFLIGTTAGTVLTGGNLIAGTITGAATTFLVGTAFFAAVIACTFIETIKGLKHAEQATTRYNELNAADNARDGANSVNKAKLDDNKGEGILNAIADSLATIAKPFGTFGGCR